MSVSVHTLLWEKHHLTLTSYKTFYEMAQIPLGTER